jgi:hypothetical protein
MSKAKAFHIGDILTVTTGRMVSPTGMDGVYAILNFMTGDSLYTHQLPRAAEECTPHLLRQYPFLKNIPEPTHIKTDEQAREWIGFFAKQHGESLIVDPIPADDHAHRDPVEELRELAKGKRVVVVRQDEEAAE